MAKFHIQGGQALRGTITPVGNKNAALPMVAACLLTDQPIILHNLPLIRDVQVMLDILSGMGVSVSVEGHTATLCAAGVKDASLDSESCKRVRGSVLLAGPLLARFKRVSLPPPGGDVIGRRRLDTHFHGFEALGATIDANPAFTITRSARLQGAEMLLDEASVTATENIVMAAVLAEGETQMYNAACEPHVQNLCELLNAMGARIEGIGTNLLTIHGVDSLGAAEISIEPDFMEAGSLIAAAAATGGELVLEGMASSRARLVMQRGFARLGVEWQCEGAQDDRWVLPPNQAMQITEDFGKAVPKIEDGIWPAFPSDLMSVAIVLATQAQGDILFFEKMFESRMYFVDRLIEMGAKIVQCDPHRVMVLGPSRLSGCLLTSPDIRAGMALVIAALCADGESTIDNAQMIDRGYEEIEVRLRSLGAKIERSED